jgi:hypothetical protein
MTSTNLAIATVFLALQIGVGKSRQFESFQADLRPIIVSTLGQSKLKCLEYFGTNSNRMNTTEVTCKENAADTSLIAVCFKQLGKHFGDRIKKECGHVDRKVGSVVIVKPSVNVLVLDKATLDTRGGGR